MGLSLAASDLDVETVATSQIERFRLGCEVLRSVSPRIILISMPARGTNGPEQDYIGHGATAELLSRLTGSVNGPPMCSGMGFGDPASGAHAAAMSMTALSQRT